MCTAKAPKVQQQKPKEPTVIRNPYLDGVDPSTKAKRSGRSGLKIKRSGTGGVTNSG